MLNFSRPRARTAALSTGGGLALNRRTGLKMPVGTMSRPHAARGRQRPWGATCSMQIALTAHFTRMDGEASHSLLHWSRFWTPPPAEDIARSEEHTSELQSRGHLVCRLLLEKKNTEHREFL